MAEDIKLNEALAKDIAKIVEDVVKPRLVEVRDQVAKLEADGQAKAQAVQDKIDLIEAAQREPKTRLPDGSPVTHFGGEYGQDFKHWFQGVIKDRYGDGWSDEEKAAYRAEVAKTSGMHNNGTNSATTGGYIVPEQWKEGIIAPLTTYGVVRRECTVIPMQSDTINIPTMGKTVMAHYFQIPSGVAITASTPTVNQLTLSVTKTMGIYMTADNAFVDDASANYALTDYLISLMLNRRAYAEDTWVIGSTLSGAPLPACEVDKIAGSGAGGLFLAASGASAFATPIQSATSTILGTNVYEWLSMPGYTIPAAAENGKYMCHRSIWAAIRSRFGTTWGAAGQLTTDGQEQRSLLGYPVVLSESAPTYAACNGVSAAPYLLFGNLKSVLVGDRQDYRIETSRDHLFSTNETAFRLTSRLHWGALGNSSTTYAHFSQVRTYDS